QLLRLGNPDGTWHSCRNGLKTASTDRSCRDSSCDGSKREESNGSRCFKKLVARNERALGDSRIRRVKLYKEAMCQQKQKNKAECQREASIRFDEQPEMQCAGDARAVDKFV